MAAFLDVLPEIVPWALLVGAAAVAGLREDARTTRKASESKRIEHLLR